VVECVAVRTAAGDDGEWLHLFHMPRHVADTRPRGEDEDDDAPPGGADGGGAAARDETTRLLRALLPEETDKSVALKTDKVVLKVGQRFDALAAVPGEKAAAWPSRAPKPKADGLAGAVPDKSVQLKTAVVTLGAFGTVRITGQKTGMFSRAQPTLELFEVPKAESSWWAERLQEA
jgi:hypothetical protein